MLHGRVGLDVEVGSGRRIADFVVREALLKASGAGLRAFQELGELRMDAEHLHWRGERWHLRRLEAFEGACACVASSRAVEAVETHPIAVAELFAS